MKYDTSCTRKKYIQSVVQLLEENYISNSKGTQLWLIMDAYQIYYVQILRCLPFENIHSIFNKYL